MTDKAQRWREGTLWVGFALLLVAALITVVLPELSDEPDETHTANTADAGTK